MWVWAHIGIPFGNGQKDFFYDWMTELVNGGREKGLWR
jgi:hypothetical protein